LTIGDGFREERAKTPSTLGAQEYVDHSATSVPQGHVASGSCDATYAGKLVVPSRAHKRSVGACGFSTHRFLWHTARLSSARGIMCVCSSRCAVHLTTRQTEEAPRSLQMCSWTSLTKEGRETEQMPRRVERECAARVSAHIVRSPAVL